jgi:hypothetical protein
MKEKETKMGKIIQLYSPQEAESISNNLNFQKEFMEDPEYFASWFSHTLGLNSEQEQIVRKELCVPKGEFEGLKKRIRLMEEYAQPTMLGGNQ